MPGPGRKGKPKAKSTNPPPTQSKNNLPDSFFDDIENAEGWTFVVNVLCDHFDLPDISTRSGLKKVHTNFESIYRRLDKAYSGNASNFRLKGGIVGIYARMCVDSLLRNKLFERGFLGHLFPLVDEPSCRHLALRALTTVTHHGGLEVRVAIAKHYPVLLRVLKDLPDDERAVELSVITLSHCLTAAFSDEGKQVDPQFTPTADLRGIVEAVTTAFRRAAPSRTLSDHAVKLLSISTLHCQVPPATVDCLVAGLRSKDWIVRSTCLGGLIDIHQKDAEEDQRHLDPMKLMQAVMRPAPSHLSQISGAYGFQRCETYLTLHSSREHQSAMMKAAQTHDLYVLGLSLAGLIPRTEFALGEGFFQSEEGKLMDVGLPFTMWSDALPHCARAIRAKGLANEIDLADILEMKFAIMKQRIPDAVKIANASLKRNPNFAYAFYSLSLASDPVVGLRASKKGMRCQNITPFVRFQLMQRAVQHAGEMGMHILQEASSGDKKWEEGIAFLTSALEDSKTFVSEAPPDNRYMKNILYWNIILRIMIDEEISLDLRELQPAVQKLKIADDYSNWIGVPPPKTLLRLTQQTIVKLFPAALAEWGPLLNDTTALDPSPSAEKVDDDLAAWLEDMHLHEAQEWRHPETTSLSNTVKLYRCSWCGNPSAVLRKCACSKVRYCDPACQKSHWKEHKKFCAPEKTEA
ncbi:hypothetical protein FB45DRAFT_977452 [Roridomyces roridus]|uniref:MYND-type domain-containing protein n=1 Tax=Roridomyces roridus TaxID=1738132 RepID=A0AAD7C245_9AGAR|nr:hypothetical protein FB45DRAFT_977452 [Roridomyces roridus]